LEVYVSLTEKSFYSLYDSPVIISATSTNLFIVLSSPSGVGKTTVARRLLSQSEGLCLSISSTTRPKREGEEEGSDYFFLTPAAFQKESERGDFLEEAEIFGHRYGTSKKAVNTLLTRGYDVLFDINWQGGDALAKMEPGRTVRIFLLPPSLAILEERLKKRASESLETLEKRLNEAESEMMHWPEYDYVVINDDLGDAVDEVGAILTAERLKSHRFQAQA